jgi:hypothetical protein
MTNTIQVGPNPTATLLVPADSGPMLINNNGPAIIYVGDSNAIRSGDAQGVIPVGVNGYFTVTGLTDLFACVPSGQTAQVYVLSGGQSFFAPTSLSGLGGAAVYVQATAPTQPPVIPLNSIWLNTTLGAFEIWNGSAWVIQAFTGSELITAGTIAANLLVANIVVAGIVNGTLIQGAELLAGVSPNTQIAITSSAGIGIIDFMSNVSGYLDAQIVTHVLGAIIQTIISGPVKTGHTDATALDFNSSDGTASANSNFHYFDTASVTHLYQTISAAGVSMPLGASYNAVEPGTGTVATPAAPEFAHPATLINGWTASGGGVNGAFYWVDGDITVSQTGTITGQIHILADVNPPAGPPANSVMFVLPVGWRPLTTQNWGPLGWNNPQVNNSTSLPWLNINTNGNVLVAGLEAVPAGSIFFHAIIPAGTI